MEIFMKTVSVLIPCYNEVENVVPLCNDITDILNNELSSYNYEIIFIDNYSTDGTRALLREICAQNKKVKAIFNSRNFARTSVFHGILQTSGDCTMIMPADFQVPVSLIPVFVKEWENGYKTVIGVKPKSMENKLMYGIRALYYELFSKLSDIKQIKQSGSAYLFDKSVVNIMRNMKDQTPYIRGMLMDIGLKIKEIPFVQPKRRFGKSHFNFYALYDISMMAFTGYTKLLRIATFTGAVISVLSLLVALYYLIMKLTHFASFAMGIAPIVIGVFFLGSLQLFFIGLVGEYIMAINQRVMNRPLVIEEERINFDEGNF
jgi:glycosyltransferase involved in cell wall biosynthesis